MADVAVLAWRQYRLERRMFWRNPSAAFFNFVLPLLFLAAGGAILSGSQSDLDKLLPAIAAMSVMATTFTALAYNIVFLRERGVLKRIRGTPLPTISYFGGVAANARLRVRLTALAADFGLAFVAPPPALCTDNGAMIAWAGLERLRLGLADTLDAPVHPRWPLDPDARAK